MGEEINKIKLRKAAEAQFALTSPKDYVALSEDLQHELQVHQIELQMQNEELQTAYIALEESRDQYFELYEFAPVSYISLSKDTLISKINLTACTTLGIERAKLINRRFSKFIAPNDLDKWHHLFTRMMSSQHLEKKSFDLEMIHADGSTFYSHIDCLRTEQSGFPPVLRMTLTNITELKQAEAALRISAIAFEAQEGIFVTDAQGLIIKVNESFTSITGYSSSEIVGKNPNTLSSGRHDSDFYESMWTKLSKFGYWKGEIWNKRKSGEIYPEQLVITAVKNNDGIVSNYVATFTDITMSRDAADEIQHLAFYDPLTRLPNRRLMMDRLKLALAASARSGKQGALLFLDLDNFKGLNDTLGHDFGDSLLQQVGSRIESCVREGDTVSRFGGDEFVVMLEGLSQQDMEAAAQIEAVGSKILAAFRLPFKIHMHDVGSTASIGATLFSDHLKSVEDILKQADIAMYQSKTSGRNTLRFFNLQMQAAINARADIENKLRVAIELKQFKLYFQIQVDNNRRPLGAEVLIRWIHPYLGLVSPAQFIPLAEETGLIIPIGKWVLETACSQLKAWQHQELTRNLTLSVNVSAMQFHEASFVDQVRTAVNFYAINPMLLKLEPTENILMKNMEVAILKMNELKAIGVKFALDDFGTGFSSLQYLKKLPLNQLKVDQSFVKELVSDGSDQAIVRTIIAMAQSLNLEVIAAGVETEEQLQILQVNGCNHFQGYLFGKPVPLEQFEKLLKQS